MTGEQIMEVVALGAATFVTAVGVAMYLDHRKHQQPRRKK